MYIIDISHHNNLTRKDFEDLKRLGVEGVLIRSGYGKSTKQIDKKFIEHYKICRELNFKIGCYWYTYATSISEMIDECNSFIYTIKDMFFELPIFIDVEEKSQLLMKNEDFNNMLKKALYFLNNKYDCGLYTSDYYLLNKVDSEIKSNFIIWSAKWINKNEQYLDHYLKYYGYGLIQFTSTYRINKKLIDMSYSIIGDKTSEYIRDQKNGFRKKDLEQLYQEIIKGFWGNGSIRKYNLEKHGYNYREVQNYVNKRLKGEIK